MPPSIIIEGPDRCGKSTLVGMLAKELPKYTLLHFKGPPPGLARHDQSVHQQLVFMRMAAGLQHGLYLCDRSHIGELVYAPLYRGYYPTWWQHIDSKVASDTIVVLLLTSEELFKKRWDKKGDTVPTDYALVSKLFEAALNSSDLPVKRVFQSHTIEDLLAAKAWVLDCIKRQNGLD